MKTFTNHSKQFTPIGLLGVTDDGEYVFVRIDSRPVVGRDPAPKSPMEVDAEAGTDEEAGIADTPSPEEERIIKEREADYSLEGRLKHAKMPTEGMPE